ncbi:MAG: hypothetical protein HDT23_00655 [Ruminococcus sp.]|nr:hypothetical protein [Ruminococcus sp.]MDE5861749.1 hypothetical protein [Ruminococcus sp.]
MPNKNNDDKKHLFNRGLVKLAAVSVIIGCGLLIVTTERDCAEKEKELTKIQAEITAYEEENTELQRVLESDDISPYMEKVAVEERGYAYPDERRFYDTSRD